MTTTGPLHGIRVIDFGWAWAGAVCGQVLGDFGAEVIKVESRTRLDPMRQGRPIVGSTPDPNQNPIASNVNRNKRSLAINLKAEGALPLVRELVARSDVVVENMSAGTLDRIGLGYDALREVKPDLIMVSLPAAGREGDLSNIRAYGTTITGLSGLDSLTGYEGAAPVGFQQTLADPNVGLHATFAVLAALRHRRRTGRGQYIVTSQLQAALPLVGIPIAEYQLTGRVPGPRGNRRSDLAPYGNYPTSEVDRWVAIAVGSDEEWSRLCHAMDRPDLVSDERFTDGYRRAVHAGELDEIVSAWTRGRTGAEIARILTERGVAAAECLGVEGRFFNEQLREREAYVPVDHPVLGTEYIYGVPWKFSRTPGRIYRRVPMLSEHNADVMREVLGLDEDEIVRLHEQGVLE